MSHQQGMNVETPNKIRAKSAVLILGSLFIFELSACGNSLSTPLSQGVDTQQTQQLLANSPIKSLITDSDFPPPDVTPQLKFTSIKSVFSSISEITQGSNPREIFLKLRGISSLTKEFHQELLDIVRSTPSIDLNHLLLIADSSYFPVTSESLMLQILADPDACRNITPELCQKKLSQIKANAQSALQYAEFINQILISGQAHLSHILDPVEASGLLERAYPSLDSTQVLFTQVLKGFRQLSAEQKILLLNLSIEKFAWNSAKDLAVDWYKTDSDKTSDSLISLALKLPTSKTRDELLLTGVSLISELTGPQAKQLVEISLKPLDVAAACLKKIQEISAHELAEIVSLGRDSGEKDLLLSLGLGKLKKTSSSEALELIRQSTGNKKQVVQSLISIISNFSATDLTFIAQNGSYGPDREQIILANINRFNSLSASEASEIASQITSNPAQVVQLLLPKIKSLSGKDLALIAGTIISGTERDVALQAGIKLVQASDVAGDIACLKLAYNSKLEVSTTLLAKTKPLTASDLASVAKESVSDFTRDQILLKGELSITSATTEGVIAMVGLATNEKISVTLGVLPKIQDVSSKDFGTILQTIGLGETRDSLVDKALGLLKKFDGDGAALIVKGSFNNKAQNAIKLISLIPKPTGTDLDKMLAVCGSGDTRDQILSGTINLLGSLKKNEAIALYGRAYNNKEKVALLLMFKVDEIDGQVIGEIALLSSKPSTRDLIITEGLKRLKKVDVVGLISMIKASVSITERLALETSLLITDLDVDGAVAIAKTLPNDTLVDKFLIHAVDLIPLFDDPTVTTLAKAAKTQAAKGKIWEKAQLKYGGSK